MGRFGFGKKDKEQDGQEDSSRLALFGSRSKSKSPAPPTNNPYAAAPIGRTDPYSQARQNVTASQQPQPTNGGYGGPQNGPYGGGHNGYDRGPGNGGYGDTSQQEQQKGPMSHYQNAASKNSQNGYGANKYGNEGGYGAGGGGNNPYGGYGQANQNGQFSRPGGYGGLQQSGIADNDNGDANRDALFGGARERVQKQEQTGPPDYAYDSTHRSDDSRSYGAYGDRQLTAEEEEEEDVQALKQEISFMKQQDISSLRNANQLASQAEETAKTTLARLGMQGERLYNTEKNLDLAATQMRIADDQTDKLRRLNDRPFFVPAYATTTRSGRHNREIQKTLDNHAADQDARERLRSKAYSNNQQLTQDFETFNKVQKTANSSKLANRAKYQFENDSDDDRKEEEIEEGLERLHGTAKTLNLVSRAMGAEIHRQNETIDRIGQKSDSVQTEVIRGSERLKRIH